MRPVCTTVYALSQLDGRPLFVTRSRVVVWFACSDIHVRCESRARGSRVYRMTGPNGHDLGSVTITARTLAPVGSRVAWTLGGCTREGRVVKLHPSGEAAWVALYGDDSGPTLCRARELTTLRKGPPALPGDR